MLDRAMDIQPNDAATKAIHAAVDLDWKADTRPVHELINEIRAKDSASLQGVADFCLSVLCQNANPPRLLMP